MTALRATRADTVGYAMGAEATESDPLATAHVLRALVANNMPTEDETLGPNLSTRTYACVYQMLRDIENFNLSQPLPRAVTGAVSTVSRIVFQARAARRCSDSNDRHRWLVGSGLDPRARQRRRRTRSELADRTSPGDPGPGGCTAPQFWQMSPGVRRRDRRHPGCGRLPRRLFRQLQNDNPDRLPATHHRAAQLDLAPVPGTDAAWNRNGARAGRPGPGSSVGGSTTQPASTSRQDEHRGRAGGPDRRP